MDLYIQIIVVACLTGMTSLLAQPITSGRSRPAPAATD